MLYAAGGEQFSQLHQVILNVVYCARQGLKTDVEPIPYRVTGTVYAEPVPVCPVAQCSVTKNQLRLCID